jgi:hypothetical protein
LRLSYILGPMISSPALKTSTKALLLKPAHFVNSNFLYMTRLNLACARGALNVGLRRLDPKDVRTWEFSAFSQNGEDGIIDRLLSELERPNRYFVEIGASDGLENNSSCLAYVKKYDGVMVEGDQFKAANSKRFLQSHNWGVRHLNLFVSPETAPTLLAECLSLDPDFFSLDIDGNDFYVAEACFNAGLRPKVVCVEYNSAFGPDRSVTIPYQAAFDYKKAHPSALYYGVSVKGWQTFFSKRGYRFVTVDSRGINAFFVDTQAVGDALFDGLKPIEFAENSAQRTRLKEDWPHQSERISNMSLVEVT